MLLVQGTVRASELIRALQRGGRPSSLARTISEIGRIAKTLHLLAYIDDEAYRRRILRQINRGEGRHSVARAVFFDKRGELRRRYKEGQEDQLGALGLVVNAIVLWNTRYMDAVLSFSVCCLPLLELQADGDAIADARMATPTQTDPATLAARPQAPSSRTSSVGTTSPFPGTSEAGLGALGLVVNCASYGTRTLDLRRSGGELLPVGSP